MSNVEFDAFGNPKDGKLRCGFCYPREQFTHGEVKREWLADWSQYVPCCRVHAPDRSVPPDADPER